MKLGQMSVCMCENECEGEEGKEGLEEWSGVVWSGVEEKSIHTHLLSGRIRLLGEKEFKKLKQEDS